MGRRKQANPVAKRPVVEQPQVVEKETKKGLVAAIWDAARQDEELYIHQIEHGGNKRLKVDKPSSSSLVLYVEPPGAFECGTRFLVGFIGVSVGGVDGNTLENMVQYGPTTWTLCSSEDDSTKRITGKKKQTKENKKETLVMEAEQDKRLRLTLEIVEPRILDTVLKSSHVTLGPIIQDEKGGYRIGVSLTEKAFQQLTSYPEDAVGTSKSRGMLQLLKELGCVEKSGDEEASFLNGEECPMIISSDESGPLHDTELDAASLYQLIKPTGDEQEYGGKLSELKPTLHGYQKRVLHWMIGREKSPGVERLVLEKPVQCLVLKRGQSGGLGYNVEGSDRTFYINPFNGMISHNPTQREIRTPPGGIACDEMGLGKTVETLALIAANPAKHIERIRKSTCKDTKKDLSTEEISCICGVSALFEYGQVHVPLLIKCSICGVWSHLHCHGLNSFSDHSNWKCSKCCSMEVIHSELIESRATLIVCPVPILSQWESEIEKHVVHGGFKVIKYLGQEQPKSNASSRVVTPNDLADADIVLTTYDVLRHDLYRNPDRTAGRSLRYEKRYHIVPTPLTSVKFWRIVVDEAQMVESSTAKATEMVKKIAAVHLWCVTGTPISRGLEDLFGLFSFLKLEPYGYKGWWSRLIQQPLESKEGYKAALSRLVKLLKPSLGGIMWRSSKADVAHEIRIPKQYVCTTELDFSNIEKHFYARQHQACCGVAKSALTKSSKWSKVSTEDSKVHDQIITIEEGEAEDRLLTKKEERKLLLPLLRLRQACVHPQVGAGGLKSLSHIKTPMSMIQVLQVMVGKAKVDAEDAQRLLLSTINGLAGLKILQEKYADAASDYRTVLKICKANESLIKADKLQILHTVFNLKHVLHKPGVGKTLEDSDLEAKIQALENSYMSEPSARLDSQSFELDQILKQEDTVIKKFTSGNGNKDLLENWWVAAIHLLEKHSIDEGEGFVTDLKRSLMQDEVYRQTASKNVTNLADRFEDIFGLKMLLGQELHGQEEARKDVKSLLSHLGGRVKQRDPSLIDAAAHCATCRSFNAIGGVVCEHCHFDKSMISWEVRLFTLIATARGKADISTDHIAEAAHKSSLYRVGMGGIGEKGPLQEDHVGGKRSDKKVADSKVTRGPSQAEKILRYLATSLKSLHPVDEEDEDEKKMLVRAAKCHLDLMVLRRKEYIKIGAVASAQRQVLYALDELNMSQMRMKLRGDNQVVSPEEERYTVHPLEIPSKLEEFRNEYIVAEADLQKSLGTLKYLKTLERLNQSSTSDQDFRLEEEPCPICHESLGNDVAMLPCGHMLCVACNVRIVEKENKNRTDPIMKCPTCRAITPASETAVVTNQFSQELKHDQDSPWHGEAAIEIKGSFGSKIEAILKRILVVNQKRPGDKIIVFSSWKDALDILAYALEQNAFEYLYPKSGKIFDRDIKTFRDSENSNAPRVLLLMLKQGGNGLNLQQAQHVIFIEPVMDPGEEAQAIGRVDRMGQVKETFIHKFVVRNSVEENVRRISEKKKLHDGIMSKHHNQNKQHLSLKEVTTLLT